MSAPTSGKHPTIMKGKRIVEVVVVINLVAAMVVEVVVIYLVPVLSLQVVQGLLHLLVEAEVVADLEVDQDISH